MREVLSDSLRRMHFSDEESDRLIDLEPSEVEALAEHLSSMVAKLLAEQYDAGYEFALKRADEEFEKFDDYWWTSGILEKLELPK